MKFNIIDVCTSAMRAVDKTLSVMAGIELAEMPEVRRTDISRVVIMTPEDTFTSVITLENDTHGKITKGGIILYLSKSNIKPLFGSLGLSSLSEQTEISDMCGEFCNVITGGFKTEIVKIGYDDVHLSPPTNYMGSVNESLDLRVPRIYSLGFSNGGEALLTIDVFLEEN